MENRTNEDLEPSANLRVVIVGYGLAGAVFHAPLIESTPGMEVTAVVTANADRSAQAARTYPSAAVFDSVDEIWDEADLFDLVVIATPNRLHAPLAIRAMEEGIPVVVDKPMATSAREARDVIAMSESTGILMSCFQNRRWDGDFLTVQRLITEDVLGPVARFESRFDRYRPAPRQGSWRESGTAGEAGGLLWDLGSHLIDQALVLFGRPALVYAEMPKRRPGTAVDDDTFLALTFENGITAHLWMSVVSRLPGPRVRVMGLRGTYEKHTADPQEDQLRSGMLPAQPGWGEEAQDHWGRLSTQIDGDTVDRRIETERGAYEQYYAGVRDALIEGRPMPVEPTDALRAIEVIGAAQVSAAERQTVQVPLEDVMHFGERDA
ncbi:MAG: oxidoreductase [Chloroflexi bacterium]|nr:MAG: oxidoreductase [Chloroflexota bacterium]